MRYAADRVLPPITQNERMVTTRSIESTNKQTGSNDTASFGYRGDSERSTKGKRPMLESVVIRVAAWTAWRVD